ncbi:MAG: ComEC/Rec2 family competence protein, partial [Desulforhabdus sp.]|nr:ComEC/Rec2 family competence protein [Desulforhabdus sp.]
LWQVSFQLSFAALIGIILFFPRIQSIQTRMFPPKHDGRLHLRKLLQPFLNAFLLSTAATMTVFPLTAYHFNAVSISALIANTLLVPLIGLLVLPIGLATLVAFALNESLAAVLLSVGGRLVACGQSIIVWFSELSWVHVWVGPVSPLYLIGFYGALALLLCSWKWRQKSAALGALTLLVGGYALLTTLSEAVRKDRLLHVTAIDVGQGSSTLVRFPTGETMLIDGGGFFDDSFDIGRHVVAPFLWHSGISKLDYVVLSHDHPDHRNGLHFILYRFKVDHFCETGFSNEQNKDDINKLYSIIERRKLNVGGLRSTYCQMRSVHAKCRFFIRRQII